MWTGNGHITFWMTAGHDTISARFVQPMPIIQELVFTHFRDTHKAVNTMDKGRDAHYDTRHSRTFTPFHTPMTP